MAKDFYNFIGLHVANIWIQAALDVGFYIGLYAVCRLVLKVIKERWISKVSTDGKKAQVKSDLSLTLYRLFTRYLQIYFLNCILTSIPFLDKYSSFIDSVSYLLGLFIGIATIIKLTDFLLHVSLHGPIAHTVPLLSRICKVIICIIGLMIGLRHFNQDIWHIVTALGIGSLAVGLAAQPTLTNLIAGFNILIDRPFRPGDRIKLSSGDIGDVLEIGLRSTKIRTTDGNTLIAPNSDLGNTRVLNLSLPDNETASNIKFQFDLGADITKIKLILGESLKNIEGTSGPISVLLSSVYDGVIEFVISFKAIDYTKQGIVTDRVIEESIFALRRAGIDFSEKPRLTAKSH